MTKNIKNQHGLTLIEIIIVLVILSLLFTFLTGGLFSQGEKAKSKMTMMKMTALKSKIAEYQLEYNAIPGSLSDLTGCNEKTGSSCVPIAEDEDVTDAWGTKFAYQGSGNSYIIKSLGADRKPGGTGVDGDPEVKGP